MRSARHVPTLLPALAASTACALVLAACGGDTTEGENRSTSTEEITRDDDLAAMVPEDVLNEPGRLLIATDASYPPLEFSEDGGETFVGMDVDLGNAIGKVLGLEVEFVNATFDGILAGVESNRYDIGMSAFTDTVPREEVVDFVTYFKAGTAIAVQRGNPLDIQSEEDLCGKRVAAERGTIQLDQLTLDQLEDGTPTLRGDCLANGRPTPTAVPGQNQNAVNASLVANRADAFTADTPVVDYQAKVTDGEIEKAVETTTPSPYGIAVPKDAGTLAEALLGAVEKLMESGHYARILETWNIQDGAIDNPQINAAGAGD